jgi:hypothetical protein
LAFIGSAVGFFVQVKQYCPLCGTLVPTTQAFGQPFVCPQCAAKLQTSVRYSQRDGLIANLLGFLFAFGFGARGWWILLWGVVLWFPCILLVGSITLRYFPPKLEPWDGRKIV